MYNSRREKDTMYIAYFIYRQLISLRVYIYLIV